MTIKITTATAALLATALALTGCSDSTDETPDPPTTSSAAAPPVTLPAALFARSAPADPVPLLTAKSDAEPDERVVFEARVGGSRDPFLADRAVFFVADVSLPDCAAVEDDGCKTPWDYCCEPQDNKRKHMATVRVVDAGGQPLKRSLLDQHGLAPGKTVVVDGTVHEIDDTGNFVVDAESIYVKEG